MQSESARMSSAAEAKFRVGTPNSRPRTVKIIALDAPSEHVVTKLVRALARRGVSYGFRFFRDATLWRTIFGRRLGGGTEHAVSQTLARLRPHATMLVAAGTDGYVKDMLTALRA